MARRSDHSREELRGLILDASWEIVAKDGFEGLTARRIAAQIGYAPGTIYNLFSSMDELYLTVNGRTLDLLYKVLADPACQKANKTPLQNMMKMAELYYAFAQAHRNHWLMLFLHRLPDGDPLPDWFVAKVNKIFGPLENLLTPYYTPRQVRKRMMAARGLWSTVHGLCFLEATRKIPRVHEAAPSALDLAQFMVENFLKGIEKKS